MVHPHVLRRFVRWSLTEIPSLHRNYPASPLLRTPPPPHTARPVSHELPVDPHRDHRWGFPGCLWSPLPACRRHYPGRSDGTRSLVLFPQPRPSPIAEESAPAWHVSGPAQRLLALRPACSPTRLRDSLHQRLRRLRFLCRRSDCYRVERTSSRAGVAPAEVQRLFTAHRKLALWPDCVKHA